MRPAIALGSVTIRRPFLGVPRARLAATVAAAGLTPVHDPMNDDPRFERARVRRLLPLMAEIDPADLAASAFRLAAAADAIDAAASALLGAACAVDRFAVARVDRGQFLAAPLAVQRRAVVRTILAIGGADYPPRGDRLSALVGEIQAKSIASRWKRTLGGVVIEARGEVLVFAREFGRDGLPDLPLRPGLLAEWDHRFRVNVRKSAPSGHVLGALGEADRARLGLRAAGHPPSVAAALPAIRRRGKVVAVLGFDALPWPGWITLDSALEARIARPPLFPEFA
jgi:tRNA(Ile)-lysidine synthase